MTVNATLSAGCRSHSSHATFVSGEAILAVNSATRSEALIAGPSRLQPGPRPRTSGSGHSCRTCVASSLLVELQAAPPHGGYDRGYGSTSSITLISQRNVAAPLGPHLEMPPARCRDRPMRGGGERTACHAVHRRGAPPTFCWTAALFGGCGCREVWRKLVGVLALPLVKMTATAMWHARCRLGVRPVRALIDVLCGPASAIRTTGARWKGLLVVAIDGAHLDVADDAAIRAKPAAGPVSTPPPPDGDLRPVDRLSGDPDRHGPAPPRHPAPIQTSAASPSS